MEHLSGGWTSEYGMSDLGKDFRTWNVRVRRGLRKQSAPSFYRWENQGPEKGSDLPQEQTDSKTVAKPL